MSSSATLLLCLLPPICDTFVWLRRFAEDAQRHAAVEVYLPENQAQNVAVSEGVRGSSISASSAAPTEASLIAAAIAKLSPELAAMAEEKHRKAKSSDPGWKYGFWPDPGKKCSSNVFSAKRLSLQALKGSSNTLLGATVMQ
jgi:hypothetical protein